ncbi:hypothetical protein ACF0H5_003239 [Mactra antiquata]
MADDALPEVAQTDIRKRAWRPELENSTPNLKVLLKPILFSLSMAGCYNFCEIGHHCTERKARVSMILSILYRILVLIVILCYLAITVSELIHKKGEQTSMLSLIITWCFSLIVTHLLFLKATSSRYGHLKKSFSFWGENIVSQFEALQIEFPTLKLRRSIIVVVVIAWLITAVNVAASVIQFQVTEPTLVLSPFGKSPSTISIYAILSAILSTVWTIPAAFVILVTKIIYETFSAYNDFVSKMCPKRDCKTADDCQRIRLLHLNICKLIQEMDKDIGPFNTRYNILSKYTRCLC